jgi:hypothetical protein
MMISFFVGFDIIEPNGLDELIIMNYILLECIATG